MRHFWHKEYQNLEKVTDKHIFYFEKNKKCAKSFSEFMLDVNKTITLIRGFGVQSQGKVGIIGPTSYMWMVIDHACIRGGFQSVAIPETFSQSLLNEVINDLRLDFILADYSLFNVLSFEKVKAVYFNTPEDFVGEIFNIDGNIVPFVFDKNLIQKDYSIVFSSGTSERVKYINRTFWERKEDKMPKVFKNIKLYFKLRGSIWMNLVGKENKIIIFLPFSHPMQRDFTRTALAERMNIVLSNPDNCIKHIMLEKPNIMISVPPVYDAIAELIEARIKKFTDKEQKLFRVFLTLGLNKKSDSNLLKRWFSKRLFANIKKTYGTHADLFITGSAPTKKSTLETFYKVGVKIYEAYSQSELSVVVINSPKNFRIGSVGKPLISPAGKSLKDIIKIDDSNSEVLIKYREEYDGINKNVLNVINDYIHTGDSGYLDKDGFLFITGRIDDVIILKTGKKVHPLKLEKKLNEIGDVKTSLIYSPDGLDINAFIFSSVMSKLELITLAKKVNNDLLDHEKISNISIVSELPSVDNGYLTSTMKLKRKKIISEFHKSEFIRI